MGALDRSLERFVQPDGSSPGVQMFVSYCGRPIVDVAYGVDSRGDALTRETVHQIYCAGKPLLALSVAVLASRNALKFDTQLGDLGLPVRPSLAGISVGDLLAHRGRLDGIPFAVAQYMPRLTQQAVALDSEPLSSTDDHAYSDFQAWELLSTVVEKVTGQPSRDVIAADVLDPLGLDGKVFLGGAFQADAIPLRSNVDVAETGLPLLWEIESANRWSPASGYFSSAATLGEFYCRLESALSGRARLPILNNDWIEELVAPGRPRLDSVLQRECGFGLGFMTGLQDHDFGHHVSSTSFGHSGHAGASWGFVDPVRNLVISCHFNGIDNGVFSTVARRQTVVDAIYLDLGLVD